MKEKIASVELQIAAVRSLFSESPADGNPHVASFRQRKFESEENFFKRLREEEAALISEKAVLNNRLNDLLKERSSLRAQSSSAGVAVTQPSQATVEAPRGKQCSLWLAARERLLTHETLECTVVDGKLKRRWDQLNEILAATSKSKKVAGSEGQSTPYSAISWEKVKGVYDLQRKKLELAVTPIDEEKFNLLVKYLSAVAKCVQNLEGKEAKRMFFIVPIIVMVCATFDDVEILVEEEVNGKEIHVNGRFEMIIKRGSKRICIVEAKKEDMDQGRAQCLVGCEAVLDLERSTIVYGISTTFLSWEFYISTPDAVYIEDQSAGGKNAKIREDDLKLIVGKICTLLSCPVPPVDPAPSSSVVVVSAATSSASTAPVEADRQE